MKYSVCLTFYDSDYNLTHAEDVREFQSESKAIEFVETHDFKATHSTFGFTHCVARVELRDDSDVFLDYIHEREIF